MALKDVWTGRKWNGNYWKVIRRFLNTSVGQPWSKVYSEICDVAADTTFLGQQIRRCVDREVDHSGDVYKRPHPNDFFVDKAGILRKDPERPSWKAQARERKNKAPINQIRFKGDGPDLWYELVECHDGRRDSPYTRAFKQWYRHVRKHYVDVFPIWEFPYSYPHGKKIGVREVPREEIERNACNHKMVKLLQSIATRQRKITKLYYSEHWNYANDERTTWLVAEMEGKST